MNFDDDLKYLNNGGENNNNKKQNNNNNNMNFDDFTTTLQNIDNRKNENRLTTEKDVNSRYNTVDRKLRQPMSFVTWNCNGLALRLTKEKSVEANDFFESLLTDGADVVAIQEVRLRAGATPETLSDATLADRRDAMLVDSLLARLGSIYRHYFSLSKRRYAGQLMLVKKDVQLPVMKYVLDPSAASDVHDIEGRVIWAHFDCVSVLSTYTPNNGNGDSIRLKRRLVWDRMLLRYLKKYFISAKVPLVYIGDLNVAPTERDVSHGIDYWRLQYNVKPDDADDCGFAGTTVNEQTRFFDMLNELQLVDCYRLEGVVDEFPNQYTARGEGYHKGKALRLDHVLVSQALAQYVESMCIEGSVATGHGFYGSDHCPVAMKLKVCWHDNIILHETSHLHSMDCYWLNKLQSVENVESLRNIYHTSCSVKSDSGVLSSADVIVLFDSGALNGNFCHPHLFYRFPSLLADVFKVKTAVALGDQRTKVPITQAIFLWVAFEGSNERPAQQARVQFYILGDTNSLTISRDVGRGPLLILGLPSIFSDFGEVYRELTNNGFAQYGQTRLVIYESIMPYEFA